MKLFHRLSLLILAAVHLSSSAQMLSPEQMKSDLATLEENLFLTHIDVDRYHSVEEIELAFQQIESQLRKPLHPVEFYRELLPLLPLIANGHTEISPPKSYFDSLRNKTLRFPFDVFLEDDKLLVFRDMSRDSIFGEGVELVTVNGVSALKLIHEMASKITRDGYNRSMPMQGAVQAFKSYYAFHYGCPASFDIEYKKVDGTRGSEIVHGEPLAIIAETRKKRYTKFWKSWGEDGFKAYELVVQGDVAIMTLNTFSKKYVRKLDGRSYKKFFKRAFETIEEEGVDHLIIDMRSNGGGDPEPTIDLFAYLHPEPFTFYRSMMTKVNKIPNGKLYENSMFFTNMYSRLMTKKRDDGLYDVTMVSGLKESKPKNPYFDGKVYVLTSPSSFSATGEMTGILKEYDRAIFIGEEAGGNPHVNVSGFMPNMILPYSKVRVQLPIVRFEMNINFDSGGRGVIPDYEVRPSFEDAVQGKDAVMEYTLELIKGQ